MGDKKSYTPKEAAKMITTFFVYEKIAGESEDMGCCDFSEYEQAREDMLKTIPKNVRSSMVNLLPKKSKDFFKRSKKETKLLELTFKPYIEDLSN